VFLSRGFRANINRSHGRLLLLGQCLLLRRLAVARRDVLARAHDDSFVRGAALCDGVRPEQPVVHAVTYLRSGRPALN
jgi:hypothetical protein